MNRRISMILLLLLASPPAPARGEPTRRVGILPIEAMNIAPREARRAGSLLRAIIVRRSFEIVPREAVDRALAGRPPGCAREVQCLRQVGRALRADTLLALRAGRLGDTLVVQLSAFDVRRGVRQGTWEEMLRAGEGPRLDGALRRMVASFAPPPQEPPKPWYRRWWIWTALGAAAAGAAVAIAVGARDSRPTPDVVIRPPPP